MGLPIFLCHHGMPQFSVPEVRKGLVREGVRELLPRSATGAKGTQRQKRKWHCGARTPKG